MFLSLDDTAKEPLFAQIVTQIRLLILAGKLKSGERLPSARAMGESLDVNLHTVLKAYQQLQDEGIINLRRGRGAVVASGIDANMALLRGQVEQLVKHAAKLEIPQSLLLALVSEISTETFGQAETA